MLKTNWQDPGSSEIISSHISGLQEAVGKIEDVIGIQTVAETDILLTEVYISDTDRYRIFQAPAGKRNWVASPAPVIKKNAVAISSGFVIDYGGGAIILSPSALDTDVFTADFTRTVNASQPEYDTLAATSSILCIPPTAREGYCKEVSIAARTVDNILGTEGDCEIVDNIGVNGVATKQLDSTRKVFGSNSIKVSFTTIGDAVTTLGKQLFAGKYYFISYYLYQESGSFADCFYDVTHASFPRPYTNITVDLGKFKRQGFKVSITQDSLYKLYVRNNANPSVLNIDGIMFNEITEDEYNNVNIDQLMDKYNYINDTKGTEALTLQSVGKNLVQNGNGEYGILYWNVGLNWNGSYFYKTNDAGYDGSSNYFRVCPLMLCTFSCIGYVSAISTSGAVNVQFLDKNLNIINASTLTFKNDTSPIRRSVTFTSPGNAYWCRIYEVITVNTLYFSNVQLEHGSVATTYVPHVSNSISLPAIGNSVPNGTADRIYQDSNGQWWREQNVEPYELSVADIVNLVTTESDNFDIVQFSKKTNAVDYNSTATQTGQTNLIGYGYGAYVDDISMIGKIYTSTLLLYGLCVAKGTYADLAAAQAALASTRLLYQLATPVITQLDNIGSLKIWPNGTVYVILDDTENSTIPTISLDYPTNVAGQIQTDSNAIMQQRNDYSKHLINDAAHGATSAATANCIVLRDDNGRAKIAAPSESDDIARKQEVDDLAGEGRTTETVKGNSDALASHLADYEHEVKGDITLTNIVQNGNFVDGDDWTPTNSVESITSNILTNTGNGGSSFPYEAQLIAIPNGANRKYYVRCLMRVTNDACTKIILYAFRTSGTQTYAGDVLTPIQNQWYVLSGIVTLPEDTGDLAIRLRHEYIDAATANGKVMEAKEVLALDITGTSLENKSSAEIDSIIDTYFGWFGGTKTSGLKGDFDAHLADSMYYSTTKSGLDANGIYTTVQHKRADNTLILSSVLSGGTSPAYTTRTETKYATDGVTQEWQKTYTITYDVNGNVESEVLSA